MRFTIYILVLFTFVNTFSQKKYNNEVVPIDKSRFTKGLPQDSISLRWQKLLNIKCDDVLNTWWNENQTKGNEGKYIFKKTLEPYLPFDILYRKKKGFGVPLKYYLRGELKDMVEKYVIKYNGHDFYNKEIVKHIGNLIEKNNWGKDHSRMIWAIMMFNMWHEYWFANDVK